MANKVYYRDIEKGMLWLNGAGWDKPEEEIHNPNDYLKEAKAVLQKKFAEAIRVPKATAEQIAESRTYTYDSHTDGVARKLGPELWKHYLAGWSQEGFKAEAEETIITLEGFAQAAEEAGDHATAEETRRLIKAESPTEEENIQKQTAQVLGWVAEQKTKRRGPIGSTVSADYTMERAGKTAEELRLAIDSAMAITGHHAFIRVQKEPCLALI